MENVRALNRQFMIRLLDSLYDNVTRYTEDESWIEDWAGNAAWDFDTPCEFATSLDLKLDPEKVFDLENAIRMHKALPNLTLVQAQDARLWTRLTHIDLWEYMRSRWPVEKHLEGEEPNLRPITDRYFVALKPHSRSLVHNGAARLWWAARMTCDPERANPYELTSVLLSQLDIFKNLLERNFGRAMGVTKTFLEFLLLNKEECLASGERPRQLVRDLSKAVNLHGGICVLDCKGSAALTDFLNREKQRLVAKYATIPDTDEEEEDDD
jgi:hypothetical protein